MEEQKINPFHTHKYHLTKKEAPHGFCLLSRDKETWGDEGTGSEVINPNAECQVRCPHYNDQNHDSHEDIIHLNIASFRDRLCPRTLYNLFHKASNPKRIYVRIIQQLQPESNIPDDADCWDEFCKNYPPCEPYKNQVRIWTMNAKVAQGPTDPRSKLSEALIYDYENPEDPLLHPVKTNEYCMQTDSHMDFNQDFDSGLIDMFHRTKNDYAVLSTYVAPMEQTDTDPASVPHLCMVKFTNTWRNWGTKSCDNLLRPKLTNIPWGAGLSFEKCHADLNVPYDPFLPNIFDGEELSRGFRFWTFGYDVYTPDKVLVTHDYHGHQSNPHVHSWGHRYPLEKNIPEDGMSIFMANIEKTRASVGVKGVKRLNLLMGIERKEEFPSYYSILMNSRYGLGKQRSIEQAIEFSGFDPVQKKMIKNRCGNLNWVPFDEADEGNYGVETTLARPLWNEVRANLTERNSSEVKNFIRGQYLEKDISADFKTKPSFQRSRVLQPSSENNPLHSLILIILSLIAVATMVVKSGMHNNCRARKTARLVV